MGNLSINAGFDTERTVTAAFTGSYQAVGTALTQNPVIIIFDNQSTVTVTVSVDGVNAWKTFVTSEALLLDLRANNGTAPNFSIPIGTQFYVSGTGGTGQFSIAVIYAK